MGKTTKTITIYTCDRCGKEIEDFFKIGINKKSGRLIFDRYLCKECVIFIRDVIDREQYNYGDS